MSSERVHILRLNSSVSTVQCKKYSPCSCPNHYHQFYEIELIVSGNGTHLLNGTSYPLRPGEMHLLRPTDFHELVIEGQATVHLIQIPTGFLDEQVIQTLQLNRGNLIAFLSDEDFIFMDGLCALLECQSSGEGPYQTQLMENLLNSIILYFLNHIELSNLLQPTSGRMRDILSYMQTHFSEDIGVGYIAGRFFLSKNYLCSLFKKEIGMTVLQYLRELRLEHAAYLSVTTEMRSIEICEAVGYRSVSNFLRDFKQKYHLSPLQLRTRSCSKTT